MRKVESARNHGKKVIQEEKNIPSSQIRDQLRWESQLSMEADKREALTDIAKSCLSRM